VGKMKSTQEEARMRPAVVDHVDVVTNVAVEQVDAAAEEEFAANRKVEAPTRRGRSRRRRRCTRDVRCDGYLRGLEPCDCRRRLCECG